MTQHGFDEIEVKKGHGFLLIVMNDIPVFSMQNECRAGELLVDPHVACTAANYDSMHTDDLLAVAGAVGSTAAALSVTNTLDHLVVCRSQSGHDSLGT